MKRHKSTHRSIPVESIVERAARPRHSGAQLSGTQKALKHKMPSKGRLRSETLRGRKREYALPSKQRTEKNNGHRSF